MTDLPTTQSKRILNDFGGNVNHAIKCVNYAKNFLLAKNLRLVASAGTRNVAVELANACTL